MAEFTDPTVFAMQAIHVANTPSRRAMGYRLIADMFDAHLITHDAAQQLLDTLDRRSVMGEVLGMDPAQ